MQKHFVACDLTQDTYRVYFLLLERIHSKMPKQGPRKAQCAQEGDSKISWARDKSWLHKYVSASNWVLPLFTLVICYAALARVSLAVRLPWLGKNPQMTADASIRCSGWLLGLLMHFIWMRGCVRSVGHVKVSSVSLPHRNQWQSGCWNRHF